MKYLVSKDEQSVETKIRAKTVDNNTESYSVHVIKHVLPNSFAIYYKVDKVKKKSAKFKIRFHKRILL